MANLVKHAVWRGPGPFDPPKSNITNGVITNPIVTTVTCKLSASLEWSFIATVYTHKCTHNIASYIAT